MKPLLIVVVGLMMWGPPRIRLDSRPLETALQEPFDLDLAAMFQVAVWAVGALLVLLAFSSRALRRRPIIPLHFWKSSLRLYLLYGLVGVLSALYSSSPLYTLYFAAKILTAIFAITLITDQTDLSAQTPTVLQIFFAASIGQMVLNVIAFAIDPSLVGRELPGVGYRLAGGIFEDYGTSTAMAGCFFLTHGLFHAHRFKRTLYFALYGITWVFIILSRTRSTMIGAAAVLLLALAFYRRAWDRMLSIILVVIAMTLVVITESLDSIVTFGMRGETMNSLLSLTGRAQAFEFLRYQWEQSPWLGFGYAAGSRQSLIQFVQQSGLGIGAAHDAASKVLVELGIVGASILFIIFLISWIEVIQLLRSVAAVPKARPLVIQLLLLLMFFSLLNAVSAGIAEASLPYLVIALTSSIARKRIGLTASPSVKVMNARSYAHAH